MARTTNSVIKIGIEQKTTGQNEVKSAVKGMNELSTAVRRVRESTRKSVNLAAMTMGLDVLHRSLLSLQSATQGLIDAYKVQEAAETRLETVMRQRMSATDETINKVKALTATQQELGVIGDEVQLQGAQQMATFLNEAASLNVLIPAMNDLLAQQKGLSATGTDAVAVANLMGKAMTGQTSALKRVGIVFDEAQEKVLKYGTESERAAMLAEVITQNVGHMNSELAKTSSGKMQQLSNTMGDVREKLGKMVMGVSPFLTMASQATTASVGAAKLVAGFKTLNQAIHTVRLSTITLGTALRGVLAMSGIGLALVAISAAMELFSQKTQTATDALSDYKQQLEETRGRMKKFEDAAAELAGKEIAKIDTLLAKIKDETTTRKARVAAVRELQSIYPDYFGKLNAEALEVDKIAKAYEVLKENILKASRARAAQTQLDTNTGDVLRKEMELKELTADIDALSKVAYSADIAAKNAPGNKGKQQYAKVTADLLAQQRERRTILQSEIAELKRQNDEFVKIIEAGEGLVTHRAIDLPTTATPTAQKPLDLGEVLSRKPQNLKEFDQVIADLKELRSLAQSTELPFFDIMIANVERSRKAFEGLYDTALPLPDIIGPLHTVLTFDGVKSRALNNLGAINDAISDLNTLLLQASRDDVGAIQSEIDRLNELKDTWLGVKKDVESKPVNIGESLKSGWSGIKTVRQGVQDMAKVMDENASAWDRVSSAIDGFISVVDGISAVIKTIETLSSVTTTSAAAEVSAHASTTAAATTDATAQVFDAAAKTMNAHSWIPFVGIALGVAAVGAMLATMLSMPKFAKGGIAYGPTVGMFGEYPGASNNPEVVAPLDKLRSLIGDTGGGTLEVGRIEIEGDKLVAVIERRTRKQNRAR